MEVIAEIGGSLVGTVLSVLFSKRFIETNNVFYLLVSFILAGYFSATTFRFLIWILS